MKLNIKKVRDFINPLLSKKSIDSNKFDLFKRHLNTLKLLNQGESEEHQKNAVRDFLVNSFGYTVNTKGRIDLAIFKNHIVEVIIEAKSLANKTEMITKDELNRKAFAEAIKYFMDERKSGNYNVRHIMILTAFEWFVFDAKDFERLFWQDKDFKKIYKDYTNPDSLLSKTGDVYNEFSALIPKKKSTTNLFEDLEIDCAYFNLKENHSEKNLIAIYKLLSSDCLLKEFNPNDANSLNREFYTELLYILGLEEVKEGGKKLIGRAKNPQSGSLYENILEKLTQYGKPNDFESIIKLMIIWINRILFLKLLESQIVKWNNNQDYRFLNTDKIDDYDQLEMLFFEILAKKQSDRKHREFDHIPYLNSSLFEPHEMEESGMRISNLYNADMNYSPKTVIKDEYRAKKTGEVKTLHYLFEFLDAYDFSSDGTEEIGTDNKALINASVLGLIFEKLNGYKDGSFYTPSFITMYMARESIIKAVIAKFNESKGWNCQNLIELHNKIDDIKEANILIDSLKICDPAVGSGHFLVSALNEILFIKSELGVLIDEEGKRIRDCRITVENDELIVKDSEGEIFEYKRDSHEKSRIQKTLFKEKQNIIENCLFGVDINPNSVNICRLRLWVELLKNAYYKEDGTLDTLPNIDINIKWGNSLISRFGLTDELKIKNIVVEIENYKQRVSDYKENLGTKKDVLEAIKELKKKFRLTLQAESKAIKDRNQILKNYVLKYGNQNLSENLAWIAYKNNYGLNASLFGEKVDKKEQKKLYEEILKYQAKIDEIEEGKIYENAFEWRFEFPEVLDKNGDFVGFDVVIGNPPYGADLSNEDKNFFKLIYQNVHMRTPDTFNYFISKAMDIIKNEGILSFIVPNNLFFQNEYEKTRAFIINQQLNNAINFGDGVFEDANVPTCIFDLKKIETTDYHFNYLDIRNEECKTIDLSKFQKFSKSEILRVPSLTFGVETKSLDILEKVQEKSYLIEEIALEVASGISTGGDKILRIDEKTIYENKIEDEILYPVLVGREINRYELNDTGHKIIYTTKNLNINSFPNTLNYLQPFEDKLSKKRETQKGTLPWWCLHWSRYKELFVGSKILIRQTADSVISTFDSNNFFVLNSILVFKIDKKFDIDYKFALAILNSKLTTFIYQNLTQEEGRGFAEVKPKNIRKLFIPKIDKEAQALFIALVDQILDLKREIADQARNDSDRHSVLDTESKALEAQIDSMVYKLYNLTDEEIAIVEGHG